MSNPKITPKNLSYDSTLPPFLQRLQNANLNSGLDGRHERAIARPKRARTAQDEEDDMPTYVDEETGDVVEKDEYAALVGGAKAAEETRPDSKGRKDKREEEEKSKALEAQSLDRGKENVAGIGAAKKRKVGKVVGVTDEEADDSTHTAAPKTGGTQQDAKSELKSKRDDAPKVKKKARKIKLSFNDDDAA